MAEISIIIVNWNSKDYVSQCLASLALHHRRNNLEVIVVDSGSFDGCADMLAREYPDVIYIQSDENVGFSRANNLGVARSSGRLLFFLNPDTEFISDSVDALARRLTSLPDAGAVGCRLLNADRSFQASCIQCFPTVLNQLLDSAYLRERFPRSRLWGKHVPSSRLDEPFEVEALSGACILAKRECVKKIGGFSESYFMYGEDVDLCFRLSQAGYKTYHIPETSMIHYGGRSSSQAASDFSTVMMRESIYRLIAFSRGRLAANAYRFTTTLNALARLALIGPMLLLGDRIVRHGKSSLRKWLAILRWSLGLPPRIWLVGKKFNSSAPQDGGKP
jgi:N-acetylglucosaminyl-diphospho-decaprenol L-rhamnosyltransferase